MVKIEENTNKINELDRKLEQLEKVEIDIQKKLEAHEDKIENKLQAFETRLIEMSKQMEEKNNKITALENILKKTSDKLENTKKAKDIKFKCNMCDFQSGSQSGLKTHISRKHTNYEHDASFKCEICDDKYIKEEYLKDHMITHSYYKSEFLKFKCDECDFWGPNAHTMKMHYFRLHCENVSCGSCNLEVKDVEELDIHTTTCEIFKCKWCDKSYNNFSDIKSHAKTEHNGKSSCYQYNRMRIHKDFFSDKVLWLKDLI